MPVEVNLAKGKKILNTRINIPTSTESTLWVAISILTTSKILLLLKKQYLVLKMHLLVYMYLVKEVYGDNMHQD